MMRSCSQWLHRDWHSAEHGIAGQRVAQCFVEQGVEVGAGAPGGDAEARAGEGVAPAVRQADHAGLHVIADLDLDLDRALAAGDPGAAAVAQARRVASIELTRAVQWNGPLARTGRLCIQLLCERR